METKREVCKFSELGWIPEDWEVVLLDDFALRKSGHTPGKAFDEYYNGGIKWVSLADSFRLDNGIIDLTQSEISLKGLENSSAVLLPPGTVILSRDAGVGKSAILGSEMAVSQHFMAWICGNQLDNWYLYRWLQLKKGYFERQAVGTTIKTIGLPFFKKMKIALPPLPEQRAIAAVLGCWDKAIGHMSALIAQKQARKKWLMQMLLTGKKRLPGFEGEWRTVRLGEVFDRVTSKNEEGCGTVVTISAQRGFVLQTDFFNKSVASTSLEGYFLVKKGDFCYNKSYSGDYEWGAIKRLKDFEKAVVTTLYICFRLSPSEDHVPDFWEWFFEAQQLNKGLSQIAHEGGRAHGLLNVTPSDFFGLETRVPGKQEQLAIANVMLALANDLKLNEQRLTALEQQKRGLMQELLMGKKRLNEIKYEKNNE